MDEWLKTRNLPLHFISVAGLVYKGDEVLLIKSKRRGWEIPGGVVEQGEDIISGLKREIFNNYSAYRRGIYYFRQSICRDITYVC